MRAFPVQYPRLWLTVVIASLSVLAGAVAASQYQEVARLILTEVLQPGRQTVFMVPDTPGTRLFLPVKLFVVGTLSVACPSIAAWLVTQRPGRYAVTATGFLLLSNVNGKSIGPRLRGEITRLGAVPVAALLLCGPFAISFGGFLSATTRRPRSTQ
jgi:hypothetical protein